MVQVCEVVLFSKCQSLSCIGDGESEFYGWGPEDWERYERWLNLGYRIGYAKGCLFHLSHPRDLNGYHNSNQQKMFSYYVKDTILFLPKKKFRNVWACSYNVL